MKIIALNHVTFREKTLPSLRCKLNCFHCHSKLNVHVVADLCQKHPKNSMLSKMCSYPSGTFSDKVPQKYLQSCIGRFIHYYLDSYPKLLMYSFDQRNHTTIKTFDKIN